MPVKIDMDMPKSCYNCSLVTEHFECAYNLCDIMGYKKERHPNCPLKECK